MPESNMPPNAWEQDENEQAENNDLPNVAHVHNGFHNENEQPNGIPIPPPPGWPHGVNNEEQNGAAINGVEDIPHIDWENVVIPDGLLEEEDEEEEEEEQQNPNGGHWLHDQDSDDSWDEVHWHNGHAEPQDNNEDLLNPENWEENWDEELIPIGQPQNGHNEEENWDEDVDETQE